MRIYLTRHGESEYNVENRLGGDPGLTQRGREYAHALQCYCKQCDGFPTMCFTSTKKRTIETAAGMAITKIPHAELDEINAGVGEHMTYEEFAAAYPMGDRLRATEKLTYRYPSGESYIDVIERTRQLAVDTLRRGEDILIVCHRAVARALVHHFTGVAPKRVPFIDIPLHSLLVIEDGQMTSVNIDS
jgi:broad specificity phosphatase PhoE